MGRGWKRTEVSLRHTAPVPYPTTVLQMDQTAPADQGFLRHQRERGKNSNLDCGIRVCAGGDRAQAVGTGGQPVPDPTDSQPHALRESAHFMRPAGALIWIPISPKTPTN